MTLLTIALVAAACSAPQVVERAHSTSAPPSAPRRITPTAAAVTTAPTTAPTSTSSPLVGGLQVEGFADVVADQLQMREAPGLAAEVLREPLFGDYPPGTEFPPVTVGRNAAWTRVYLLDGPVAADGFEWYLAAQAAEAPSSSGFVGWVAAGDAEDAWLVPSAVACPDDPVQLADVTMSAMSRLEAINCLGGRDLTLRGYYVAPPPGEPEDGECVGEPAWLVCSFGWHGLRPLEAAWAGDANHLPLHLHPDLGRMPPRPGWVEVTGQFDHPAAANCGEGGPAADLGCRMEFVVTGAAPATAP